MASTMLLKGAAHLQAKAAFGVKPASKQVRLGHRLVSHAEKKGADKKPQEDTKSENTEKVQKAERGGEKGSQIVEKTDRKEDLLFFASDQSLSYLDGTLPADYGFDPLGLSDPEGAGGFVDPDWLRYSEVIHCRWAMLGAAGMIIPEMLAAGGLIPQTSDEVAWFKTGVIPPAGNYGRFWCDPYALFFIEVIAFQFAELRRWQDYKKPGSMGKQYFLGFEKVLGGSGNPSYPGGAAFNFMGFGRSANNLRDLQIKEVKNGRLAMIAVLGFGAQAVITRQGPFQNLLDHLSNPAANNILTNFGRVYSQTP
ncbi:Photosystem I chlorophyll a/b-binding protein 3-1, chloroplastic [Trebouxia sp. C0010 RCD-2024]